MGFRAATAVADGGKCEWSMWFEESWVSFGGALSRALSCTAVC